MTKTNDVDKPERKKPGRKPTPLEEQCKRGRYMTNISPEQARPFLELCKILRVSHSCLIRQFTIEGTIKKRRELGLVA